MRAAERRRAQLPRAVAFLGECGPMVLHDPNDGGRFLAWTPRTGTILASDPDGRTLFLLRPRPRNGAIRETDQAIRAARLYERFSHKRADGYYNSIVPSMRRPKFAGEVVIIRYRLEKALDDLDDDDPTDGVTEWEHYFEEPGRRPAYPHLYSVGNGQYIIAPGPFAVKPEGITYAQPPTSYQEIEP